MQKLIQGFNRINQLKDEIEDAGYDAVFLVTGEHWKRENDLTLFNELQVTHFIKSGTNVGDEEAQIAFEEFQKNDKQAIVAIGGGSVIDIAKVIIYRCIESALRVPFFAAAPSTAGSGSEATHFAVVYQGNKKKSLVHAGLLPKVALLDAQLSFSLSPYQTAVSGMDALAQAVESFWNVHATWESRQFAAESIGIWTKYFLNAVKNPDREAREKMLWSAHLAGKAINITRTTGPHALSYYLTANYNIPHGQAVALFLPVFFIYNNPGNELCSLLNVKNAEEANRYTGYLMKEAGLATTFSELGLAKESIIEELLNDVNEERFANNPVAFNKEKLKTMINQYL